MTGTDVTDNSIFARLVSSAATADWDTFVHTTEALQALRDRGDAAWITATGFSTHADPTGNAMALTAAAIDAIWEEDIVAAHGTADTAGLILRALGALISQRTNNATLNALLGVTDAASQTLPIQNREELLPKQNEALSNIPVYLVDATDGFTPETGLSPSVTVSKDGGAPAAIAGSITEVASGVYEIDATAADMNAGICVFRVTDAAARDFVTFVVTSGGV